MTRNTRYKLACLREFINTMLCILGLVALLGLAGMWDRDSEKADECWAQRQVYDPQRGECTERKLTT